MVIVMVMTAAAFMTIFMMVTAAALVTVFVMVTAAAATHRLQNDQLIIDEVDFQFLHDFSGIRKNHHFDAVEDFRLFSFLKFIQGNHRIFAAASLLNAGPQAVCTVLFNNGCQCFFCRI